MMKPENKTIRIAQILLNANILWLSKYAFDLHNGCNRIEVSDRLTVLTRLTL